MNRQHLLLIFAAVLVVTVSTVVPLLTGSALAEDGSEESKLLNSLERQGIHATSIELQGGTLQVVLPSVKTVTDDAWARTLAIREAAFLAEAGQLTAGNLGVSLLDEKGAVVYHYESPIEPRKRPAAGEGPTADLAAFQSLLAVDGLYEGVTVKRLAAVDNPDHGLIVECESMLDTVQPGKQEQQLRWATLGLLSRIRDLCESTGALTPDLYRLTVKDEKGTLLVSYVVEPDIRAVRVWSAPGLPPVWR